MILLAVDTALDACAAAVATERDGTVEIHAVRDVIGRGHAEHLMRVVDEVLAYAGVGHVDLDGYAVSVGPGSFTGIRVGVAAVRGFALASGRPAVSVTTLEALASEGRDIRPERPILAVIDARKNEVYAQAFDAGGRPLGPATVASAGVVARHGAEIGAVLIGSGAPLVAAADPTLEIAATTPFPAIDTHALLALPRLAAAGPHTPRPSPLYVRPADAKPQGAARLARLTPGGLAAEVGS
ncbi:MAG: tRNA (adenosine(37)-N6)-threonylcarbamoyltransferase complex dimerization subunit type 1 TsaB [Siculibacillus sp.]|nr:tRNA (adenosine(37)-N6)-threonylcarbamoyltransferase complex dimerization subunit type 1 TsaB [Siculibacillus sp.]